MSATLEQTVTSILAAKPAPSAEDLGEVYERAAPALYSWIAINLRGSLALRVDPEEIAQETWMRALGALRNFDAAKGPFRAWLAGIARNVLLESFRALKPRGALGASLGQAFVLEDCPDSVTSVTRAAARADTLRDFVERVAEMGEEERVLVLCCGLEGLDSSEAARRLGIAPAAAAKRWERLRARLLERDLPNKLLAG